MRSEKVSVVIPCFNEGKSIFDNIKKIHIYLAEHFSSFEIIAVNDGSMDNTISELRLAQQKIPFAIVDSKENKGKGDAVRRGILASKDDQEFVMFLDADLAIPIEELEFFLDAINAKGYDLAIASRFVPGLKIIEPVLWYRKIMEQVFRLLRKIILNSWKVQDTQCGFKVFRRAAAQRIFKMATVKRFAFDSEIIFLAKKMGYSIKELPITLQNPRKSHVRLFLDPLNMFFALMKIRMNDFNGLYRWKNK